MEFVPPPHSLSLLVSGEPVFVPVLDPDGHQWGGEEPARAARLREFGMHSLISVPMRARNTTLGLTTFVRSPNPVPFHQDDVLLARELVARAALCVDNARRYTREHTAAVTLQRSLLPHALTGGTALEVASYYLPADATGGVGGDWFDVIPLSGATSVRPRCDSWSRCPSPTTSPCSSRAPTPSTPATSSRGKCPWTRPPSVNSATWRPAR